MINIIDNSEVDAEVRAISLNHVPKTAPTEMQKMPCVVSSRFNKFCNFSQLIILHKRNEIFSIW